MTPDQLKQISDMGLTLLAITVLAGCLPLIGALLAERRRNRYRRARKRSVR